MKMNKELILKFIKDNMANRTDMLDLIFTETLENKIKSLAVENEHYRENIEIDTIKNILVGCGLGDASFLTKQSIRFEQSHKNRIYLFSLFMSMFNYSKKWPYLTARYDKRYEKHYYSWSFTIHNKNLETLYNRFNPGGVKKVVPENIEELMNPQALAHWVMDDGGKIEKGGMLINTNSYTQEEVNKLSLMLNKKFNITSKVYIKKKGTSLYNIIYIPKYDYIKLTPLMEPYFVETMNYKLGK